MCITRHFKLKDSSPIASLTTTVAAGAEGRFVVSDCDGHKRIESTHVENHFEQVCLQLGNEAWPGHWRVRIQVGTGIEFTYCFLIDGRLWSKICSQDHSIFTQDFSRREDITEDRDVPKDSSGISSFVTAPSTLARINGSNDDDDLRLRKVFKTMYLSYMYKKLLFFLDCLSRWTR